MCVERASPEEKAAVKIVDSCGQILLPWTPGGFGGDVKVTTTRDNLYEMVLAALQVGTRA